MTTLLVIGANPPSDTSGARTLARVELARKLLEFDEAVVANLFARPSYRSGGITALGAEPDGWLEARVELERAFSVASGALLAFGVQMPGGAARVHYKAQLKWVEDQIRARNLPVWWFGGAARHPSRWQRYTHRAYPDLAFSEALPLVLEQVRI